MKSFFALGSLSSLIRLSSINAVHSSLLSFDYRPVGFDGGGWVTGLETHAHTGIVYLRTDVGGAYRSDDGGASWNWLNGYLETPEYTWSTQGLAVNQSDPSGQTVLFSIGSGDVSQSSGIYKTLDGGVTWIRKLAGVAANSNCYTRHGSPVLTINAALPAQAWAGMQQGLYRSRDGGETWTGVDSFNNAGIYNGSQYSMHGGYTMSLVSLVPPDAATGRVDPALASHVVVGASVMGLAFSPDDGSSWQLLSFAAGTLPVNVSAPWRFLRLPNGTAFAGVTYGAGHAGHSASDGGVWRVDAPSSAAWADPSQWVWTDITPVAGDAAYWGFWGLVDFPLGFDGGLLVVASSAPSVFTSTDGGFSWTRRNASLSYDQPIWQPRAGQRQTVTFGRNNIVRSSRASPPDAWLMSTGFGVVRSVDFGDNWGGSSQGIGEVVTFLCHSHPTRANWTYCGAGDLTGFIINDAGASGSAIAAFHEQPAYWSTDFGHGAAWSAQAPGALGPGILSAGGYQLSALGMTIDWSAPGASPISFTPGVNTSGDLYGVSLQFSGLLQASDDPADILLLTSSGDYSGNFRPWNSSMPLSSYTGGVVRSRDYGKTWRHVAQQPPSGYSGTVWYDVPQLALDGGDANARWWALVGQGLLLSRDRGETWGEPLRALPGFCGSVVADAAHGAGAVYVLSGELGSGAALQRTVDYGVTFTVVGNFSAMRSVAWPLAAHASGRIALLGYADGSEFAHVWVSVNQGADWTAVDLRERGMYLGTGVSGLQFDRVDPSILYINCNGRSVIIVALTE